MGNVITEVKKILFTVKVFIFLLQPKPAPTREQAFIFPVLTENPRSEHRKTHTVEEKSDKNAILASFLTISLPRESIIFPPPSIVPAIIKAPTVNANIK